MNQAERLEDCLDRWEDLLAEGNDLDAAEVCRDCTELTDEVARRLAALRALAWLEEDPREVPDEPALAVDAVSLHAGAEPIADYRLMQLLGRGGLGCV